MSRYQCLVVTVAVLLATGRTVQADKSLEGIACRSVHLGYEAPEGRVFYNEVTVEQSAPGTYFCVCGFRQGYYGIQELGNGKKLLIFSIWDPDQQNDPKSVAEDRRVKLVFKAPKVRVGRFGGEGTGGQSFLDYDWKAGQCYRFLVRAIPAGGRTEFSAYFFLPEENRWSRLVTFSTLAGGKMLNGYYSFVEDFKRDRVSTTKARKAFYGNGWVETEDGKWLSLSRARFTADSNPVVNINAGASGNRFFLATGGDTQNVDTPLSKHITCPIAQKQSPKDVLELTRREARTPTRKAIEEGATEKVGGEGHRITVGTGDIQIPVVVVRGTPYQMGWHLGRLTREDIQRLIPAAMARLKPTLGATDETLQEKWARMAAYSDDRFEQELLGLSDASGIGLSTLQAVHVLPLLMPYSCSSIAAWGKATEDRHLYQTRNLDWTLAVGAHDYPVVVVYLPAQGIPHVVPTFAGMIGAHTGMNARGIALSEMGDSPAKEAPYNVNAPHFTVVFRSLLYDADTLSRALDIFKGLPQTKRYHYVFGDGQTEHRAVKIRAHAPEPPDRRIVIWKDNDPTDDFAPAVLENIVYNDEGRGAFPLLKRDYGTLNSDKMIRIANQIPIRGGNVVDVVYDATALRVWVSYAKGKEEAYRRPYTLIDLKTLDANKNGQPDLEEVAGTK